MLGYWPYATHKNIFYIFLSKTQASQLIAIKDNKPCAYILRIYKKTEQSKKNQGWPLEAKQKLFFFIFFGLDLAHRMGWTRSSQTQPGYWPKPVTSSATVACICMLQWQR